MAKTERVAMRMGSITKRAIELAADARERTISEFMREASLKEARRVLGADIEEVTNGGGSNEEVG